MDQEQLCILGSEDFVRGFRGPVLVLHGRHDFIVTWQEPIVLDFQQNNTKENRDNVSLSKGFSISKPWNPNTHPVLNGCLVISNHFLRFGNHHPIDRQPFINGCFRFQEHIMKPT